MSTLQQSTSRVQARLHRRAARSLTHGAIAALVILALNGMVHPLSLHTAGAVSKAPAASKTPAASKAITAFQTMIGNSGPYIGAAGNIRGINAGLAPWKIAAGLGELTTSGQLIISVHGLTLLNGTNPVPDFEGAVSCQSIDTSGKADIVNVFTSPFPASPAGNSLISTTVTLPTPCFAPLIFVTSPAPQLWFATTGM